MDQLNFDVIIIGAGAAGMMAAIAAGNIHANERAARVLLLDGREKIGAKILVSGGTRCNVSNEWVHPSRFHTDSDPNKEMAFKGDGARSFVGRVLRAFSPESTLRFFAVIGVELKLEETGKYFPVSDSSREVLNALRQEVNDSGAELRTGVLVQSIHREGDEWRVETDAGVLRSHTVVICSGGLALPKSGSDGDGLRWAKQFGHSIVFTTPALTPLLCENSPHAHLSGIAVPVRLTFTPTNVGARLASPKTSHQQNITDNAMHLGEASLAPTNYEGPMLFTHFGYSGPVALNVSRHVAREKGVMKMRLLPNVKDGEEGVFWQDFVKRHSKKIFANALAEYFPRRVAETISLHALGEFVYHPNVGQLNSEQQKLARAALFDWPLKVDGVADYVKAETTSGGVSLAEIEPSTMMSKLQNGLFFAGEVCDVDGWLGGYNFQWAWSSGTVAGRAAARLALKS